MFNFSRRSEQNRDTCHSNIIEWLNEGLKTSPIDFSIIFGYRGMSLQNRLFKQGFSKVKYPHSKHNSSPSLAVDIQPYPYTNEDKKDPKHTKFKLLNEHLRDVAKDLDIPMLNGGLDWGWDWFHWELIL